MGIGIRIEELHKTYQSPPPMAGRAAGFSWISARGSAERKKKAGVVALAGISLEIRPGEVFGLLGPNGAGKSTTIGILTTRTEPTSGRAFIGECDVWREQVKAKRLIGVVPQRPNLDFALTAREVLLFHGAYFGQNARERAGRADELLATFKLTDRADHMARTFSGGMMQRLSIARAMMHDPQVLFLDEPSAGLDPQTRLLLWEVIRGYNRRGKTIVLTTHYMEEADALCERLAIIDHGRIIAQGTPAELKSSIPGGYLLRLRFDRAPEELMAELRKLPGVREVRAADDGAAGHVAVDLYTDRGGPLIAAIVNAAQAWGVEVRDVHISEPSLETLSAPHRKEPARLNWKTFYALLLRDGHIARRNLLPMLAQNLLQPLLLTFVFGRVLTSSGMMQAAYKDVLLPGIMAISMVLSGVQAVAMPLIAEFQFTREIEDRLLAPIDTGWLAVEKVVAGMIQALVAGLVVIPAAWVTMGPGVNLSLRHPLEFAAVCLLVALFSGAGGLALGCSVGQTQIGLMFSLVLAPMMMFGCAYYPWSALATVSRTLQYAVLANPLVYASEGLRGVLTTTDHIPTAIVLGALLAFDAVLLAVGLRQFRRKAVN